MIADVDLAGAAALMHRSVGRFRKAWRGLAATEGFPQPFVGGEPGGRPWWRIADIETWKQAKASGANRRRPATACNLPQRDAAAAPANDLVAPALTKGDLVAQLLADAGA